MNSSKKTILLIDDEADLVEVLKSSLEAAGYEVVAAYDGEEGLEKARAQKIDLILLDVMMPGMDGYQVCRFLKFDEAYKQIPIILLSARAQAKDKETGLKVGANDYIVKPFNNEELFKKIRAWLK